MRKKELAAVKDFQNRFDAKLCAQGTPREEVPPAVWALNKRIVLEEIGETDIKGIAAGNLIETADGCGDALYVIAHAVNQLGRVPDVERDAAARVLLAEALQRLTLAFDGGPGVTPACLDRQLSYAEIVIRGIAATYEIPLDKVFAEVHRSNMTKVWKDGKGRKDEGGKVLKPDTYSRPDIAAILRGG